MKDLSLSNPSCAVIGEGVVLVVLVLAVEVVVVEWVVAFVGVGVDCVVTKVFWGCVSIGNVIAFEVVPAVVVCGSISTVIVELTRSSDSAVTITLYL